MSAANTDAPQKATTAMPYCTPNTNGSPASKEGIREDEGKQ